ncbi:phosphatidylserine decarboxylase 1 [Wolffia australiana]
MKFRSVSRWYLLPYQQFPRRVFRPHPLQFVSGSFTRGFQATRFSANDGNHGREGNFFMLSGATVATILMLGALHARRLYEDRKVQVMKERGIEPEFSPDFKAGFLKILPLRSISRLWGFISDVEIPTLLRPVVFRAWARAFHCNLDETSFPLDEYKSLQEFFGRSLKEGSRPIDGDPHCLISPVDGTVLKFGELRESAAMIEQVKGFSYSATSLLGASPFLLEDPDKDVEDTKYCEVTSSMKEWGGRSWWRISFASPKVRLPKTKRPIKGIFYCVLYLAPGDYHRVHSPVDWCISVRRHFSGHLFPVNERATRTIRNLHVENERVVLEGQWDGGFLSMAIIGATNVGSIKLFIEPELATNRPKQRILQTEPPDVRVYGPNDVKLRKGDEVAVFNMGSTVVLVFQAPVSGSTEAEASLEDFKFAIRRGDRIRVGEAIGRWAGSEPGELSK